MPQPQSPAATILKLGRWATANERGNNRDIPELMTINIINKQQIIHLTLALRNIGQHFVSGLDTLISQDRLLKNIRIA